MRMCQSVSGNSSEQSTAHFNSRRTVSQLKGVSDTISNWFENHRTQRTQIFAVTTAPFRSKLESNGLQIDHNRKFSERIFSTPAIFKATSMFFGSLGCSDDKNWLELDYAVQFYFHCKFSFHEKRGSSQVWQWRDFPGPITILCYA